MGVSKYIGVCHGMHNVQKCYFDVYMEYSCVTYFRFFDIEIISSMPLSVYHLHTSQSYKSKLMLYLGPGILIPF